MKTLASCIGQYKKDTVLAPVMVALEVVMEVLIPLLMANMIDAGITGGNMSVIARTGIALVVSAMLAMLFGTLSGRHAAKASAGFARNIRQKVFNKIQDFSFSNIDHFSTSGLVTRLTTDVTNLQNAFQMVIRICVRAPLMMIFSLFMAFSIHAQLSLVFTVVIVILAVGLTLIITKAHPVFTRVFALYDKLNGVVQENVRGIRVVKSYVREDTEIEKFENASGQVYTQFVKAEKLLAFNSPLMQFCMYSCSLLLSWFGASLIVGGSLTTGMLTSLLTYSIQILMSLMLISMALVMVTMAKASADRIVQVLNETSDITNGPEPVKEIPEGTITFENVDFSYKSDPHNPCLQGISLTIPAGSTVGIIGGTGSGKSSLVQLIPRLYDATTGSVKVGGIDVRDYDLDTLRKGVAMVLQKNVLFSGSIADNLRWGDKNATDEELRTACRQAAADEFIDTFPEGYDTIIEQGGNNVSGGQKQRLCIARALLKQPRILILDDSTSAVDTKTDAKIRKAFREDIPNTTKIIIAQRISSVEGADHIIVMDDGKINGMGTHEELLQNNTIYQEVYNSQQKGGAGHDAA